MRPCHPPAEPSHYRTQQVHPKNTHTFFGCTQRMCTQRNPHSKHTKARAPPPPRTRARPADLVDGEVGVRADDCAAAEVDSLARQVAPEATLLALETLHKTPGVVMEGGRWPRGGGRHWGWGDGADNRVVYRAPCESSRKPHVHMCHTAAAAAPDCQSSSRGTLQ